MTKPLLILGATSGIGRCAMDEAVRRGLPIRAFARRADALVSSDLVEPFVGDARSATDLANALQGVRAVIYALGITERLAMLWEEETLFSDTTRVLLDAMAAAEVSRLVAVTGFGAGRSKSAMSWIERTGHRAILGRPYADKDRQEALIADASLDWTIVRPVILTKGARSEAYKVLRDPAEWRNGLISRASVAHYLIDAVEQGVDLRADVVLTR
ncbi:MAG: NAD(P)-dependent oxidoreductase [Marivita sp.]|uniref:NAD(P)-dependent oxidoreductase n=1 Tax=Marivita sp. TaxID=2003365 RepID=UPI003EF1E75D